MNITTALDVTSFVGRGMISLDITPATTMAIRLAWKDGWESTATSLSVVRAAVLNMAPVNHLGIAGVNMAGKEFTVTNVFHIQAVCMAPVSNHGNVFARRIGVVNSATKT